MLFLVFFLWCWHWVSVGLRICHKLPHPLHSAVYVPAGHGGFFRQGVCKNRHGSLVEKVQQTVVDAAEPYPQFVDAVTEQVCLRPAEFMPHLSQTLNGHKTLREDARLSRAKIQQPIPDGDGLLVFPVQNDFHSRHEALYQNCDNNDLKVIQH